MTEYHRIQSNIPAFGVGCSFDKGFDSDDVLFETAAVLVVTLLGCSQPEKRENGIIFVYTSSCLR
jgi:hypothetical protein